MFENLRVKHSKLLPWVFFLFGLFVFWRILLYVLPSSSDHFNWWSFTWGATYQLIALIGACAGLLGAKVWGGWKSTLGRIMLAFSLGLLFQSFGQAVSSYYVYHLGEIPYPSLGDVGFFGSVLWYSYGVIALARVSGVRITLSSFSKKIQAFLVPFVILLLSYLLFVKGAVFDPEQRVKTFLDIAYPLAQAFYISIALLVYLLSRTILGGVMRRPVFFFLIALCAQYLSDFIFLYQANKGLYVPEGVTDLFYLCSYFLMTLSLIQLTVVFHRMKNAA